MEELRRKLQAEGTHALSDWELLTLIEGREWAAEQSEALLRALGGLWRLARANTDELRQAGVPVGRACRLQAAVELGRRAICLPLNRGDPIGRSQDVVSRLGPLMVDLEHEELHVLGLDAQNRLLVHFVAGQGAANVVYAGSREIFRPLLRAGAFSAVLVHNHPSGLPRPSLADHQLTLNLADFGRALGVAVVDHVIISRQGVFSFADAGLLAGAPPVAPESFVSGLPRETA